MSVRSVVDEPAFIYDWEGGVSIADMATRYGISDSTVSKVARRMGLPGRRGPTAGAHPSTHPAYALTGGQWVPAGGVMRWQRAAAPVPEDRYTPTTPGAWSCGDCNPPQGATVTDRATHDTWHATQPPPPA